MDAQINKWKDRQTQESVQWFMQLEQSDGNINMLMENTHTHTHYHQQHHIIKAGSVCGRPLQQVSAGTARSTKNLHVDHIPAPQGGHSTAPWLVHDWQFGNTLNTVAAVNDGLWHFLNAALPAASLSSRNEISYSCCELHFQAWEYYQWMGSSFREVKKKNQKMRYVLM